MGNCANTKQSLKKTEKQLKAAQQIRDEILRLKDEQLFNQALMKMMKLISVLKLHNHQNANDQEIMETYIEMGRINLDVVENHKKAYMCFESAMDVSNNLYGYNNDIANKVIQPIMITIYKFIEESQGPLQLCASPSTLSSSSSQNGSQSRKYIKRSSTHATTRVTAIPPSLNIIMEESPEHEEEAAKKWDEKDSANQTFNKNNKSLEKNTNDMQISV